AQPPVELRLPRRFLVTHVRQTLRLVGVAGERLALQPINQGAGCRASVATDADGNRFDETQHLRVGVDLDDFRMWRPVVDAMLRQRAEGPEARAQRQHDVGLGDELHCGLRALVPERAYPKRMRGT